MARPKNAMNKNKEFLINRLKDMYGEDFDPIIKAAEQATRLHAASIDADDLKPLKDSIDAWLKIGEFVTPKLKAIEISQDPENPLFEMSSDERYSEFKRLVETLGEGSGEDTGTSASGGEVH